MKHFRLRSLAAMLAMLSACHVGPDIDRIHAARQPAGAAVLVEVEQSGTSKRREYAGELLEVRDDGLVVLLPPRSTRDAHMAFIPWDIVSRVKARELPGFRSFSLRGEKRLEIAINKFRMVSRFPQGLSPELLDKLLASFDQKTIETID